MFLQNGVGFFCYTLVEFLTVLVVLVDVFAMWYASPKSRATSNSTASRPLCMRPESIDARTDFEYYI